MSFPRARHAVVVLALLAVTVCGSGSGSGAPGTAASQDPGVEITISGPALEGEHVFRIDDPTDQGSLSVFSGGNALYRVRFLDPLAAEQGTAGLEGLIIGLTETDGAVEVEGFEVTLDTGDGTLHLEESGNIEWTIEAMEGTASERVRGEVDHSRFAGSFQGAANDRDSEDTYQVEGRFDIVDE